MTPLSLGALGFVSMNKLLGLAAVLEAATGLVLIADPSLVTWLLLGDDVSGAGLAMSRLLGVALLSLGVACWPRPVGHVFPALRAMLAYGLLVVMYFLYLAVRRQWVGILLWPAVAAHLVLTLLLAGAWLRERRRARPE